MLIAHIVIALLGLVLSGVNVLLPSRRLTAFAGSAIAMTLASGLALAFYSHASLKSACYSGLAYVGFTSLLLAAGTRRLAPARQKI